MRDFDIHLYQNPTGAVEGKNAATSLVNDFDIWVSNRKWLYLWSQKPGSGKTLLASIIGNHLRGRHFVRFISAPEYIKAVGDSYKREQGSTDASKIYRECDVLILDDLGAQKRGEWQEDEIFKLIDGRKKANLMTIITSNSAIRNLNINDRTANRIESNCVEIHFPEESIRSRKARTEMEDFKKSFLGGN